MDNLEKIQSYKINCLHSSPTLVFSHEKYISSSVHTDQYSRTLKQLYSQQTTSRENSISINRLVDKELVVVVIQWTCSSHSKAKDQIIDSGNKAEECQKYYAK